jgi:hypothetical protein
MLFLNTIKNSSGEVLTGKLWRQESSLFSNLPFHSNIMGMDEITRPLQEALSICMSEEWHNELLVVSKVFLITSILDKSFPQKIGTGLDQVHPFSDTNAVAVVLSDAEKILSSHSKFVGKNNAARIWGFLSKFVMLDRFGKALGVADVHPGLPVDKNISSNSDLGAAVKVRGCPQWPDFANEILRSL